MGVESLTGAPLLGTNVTGFGTINEMIQRAVLLAVGREAVVLDLDGTTVVAERVAMRSRLLELGSGQTLGANETIELPASTGLDHSATKLYVVQDATSTSAFDALVKVTGGSDSLTLVRGAWTAVWADGSEISALRVAEPFRWYVSGAIGASSTLVEIPIERDWLLPDGLPASQGTASTAPTGGSGVAFDLKKNGAAAFGTMTFANTVAVATFAMSGDEAFAPGDILSVVAPGTVDAIAGVGFSLHGLGL
ncbi:MAG TPA: hypothetical protein VM243_07615 [Phycisphaerae bacterium]|nr:hypothetical protein [Phycisphaerae bacterium]